MVTVVPFGLNLGMSIRRIRAHLPEGGSLPQEVWDRRRRFLVVLLGLNALGLIVFALIRGSGLSQALFDGHVVAGFIAGATVAGLTVWKQNETLRASYQETAGRLAEARTRQRDALDLNDNVLQHLATADYAFELGMIDNARIALKQSLAETHKIASELLTSSLPDVQPGDLVRGEAATTTKVAS